MEKAGDGLLDMCLSRACGKEKQKFLMLKSSKKLWNAIQDFLIKYTLPENVMSFSEEQFEYLHHFFEALCESIEDFQKEVVPIKKKK